MECRGRELAEEGIGFGVPILKFGEEAIFPGSWNAIIKRQADGTTIRADYLMNLKALTARRGRPIKNRSFYRAKEAISRLHRDHPSFRRGLNTASELCRRMFYLEDLLVDVPPVASIRAFYRISKCEILVQLQFSPREGCSEVIVMNEQGASYFHRYRDSNGQELQGDAIGSWDEICAEEATFVDLMDGAAFTLRKSNGARMFRGRELVPGRLAWAGLAYVLPPETESFVYSVRIDKS